MKQLLLESLNQAQRDSVSTTEGPLLVLSGAGSGKTKTIVHRMAWLIHEMNVPARKIVAVTFTNKAAAEMSSRAIEIGGPSANQCVIRTFHSFGLLLMRTFAQDLNYPQNFTIWDEVDQRSLFKKLLPNISKTDFNKNQINYFINSISSFKDSLISPEQLSEKIDLESIEFGEILEPLYRDYELTKFNASAVDFADLLYKPVQLFQEKKEVLNKVQNRYSHFMIDEYQDTNFAQYTMMQLVSSASQNICVVGDDDQAIYGWRGADVSNILNFEKDYKEIKLTKLEENYRSTQPILDLANSVIKQNKKRMEKTLFTNKKGGSKPKLIEYPSDLDEAKGIAKIIKHLSKSQPLNKIAILYRTNTQSRLIEQALLDQDLLYVVYGGASFFGRKEIKDALAYIRLIVNPLDLASFIRVINTPARGIGAVSLQKILEFKEQEYPDINYIELLNKENLPLAKKARLTITTLGDFLKEVSGKINQRIDLGFLFEEILERSGLKAMYEEEDQLLGTARIEQLQGLKDSILTFQAENQESTLDQYLQEISLLTSAAEEEREDAIQLMTIHSAKGLEFDIVFIAGLENEIFPHFLSIREGSIDEERRLFYVAITRAKKDLYLTRAKFRFYFGQRKKTEESKFLEEIDQSFLEKSEANQDYKQSLYPNTKKTFTKTKFKFNNTVSLNTQTGDSLYKNGQRVRHSNFGFGKVLKLEGVGDSAKIHIFFEDGKTRKFILKYTSLEKV